MLALIGGGGWLAALGGSFYYLPCGLVAGGAAILLWRDDRRGAWLFGAMLVATVAWALYEVGFDIWGLDARVFAPLVLACRSCFPRCAVAPCPPRGSAAGQPPQVRSSLPC